MASPEAGTSSGTSQVGVQHLGILVPPQQISDAASGDAPMVEEGGASAPVVASEPSAALRQNSATSFNASLRARGGSLASVTGMDAALVATTAGQRLTVAGKTPKAVVSDDEEGSDSGDEEDAMMDLEQDGEEDADTADDATGVGASTVSFVPLNYHFLINKLNLLIVLLFLLLLFLFYKGN